MWLSNDNELDKIFSELNDLDIFSASDDEIIKQYLSQLLNVNIDQLDGYVDSLVASGTETKKTKNQCLFCNGSGYIVNIRNVKLVCNCCYGRGFNFIFIPKRK